MKALFPVFYNSDSFPELIKLTRVLLLSPVFLGFSNLLASITQINRRFFIYAISPVVYNLGIIFGIVFLYPVMGLSGLGAGVVIGAFLHFAIQVPFIISQRMFPVMGLSVPAAPRGRSKNSDDHSGFLWSNQRKRIPPFSCHRPPRPVRRLFPPFGTGTKGSPGTSPNGHGPWPT
jgi:hypothetical protein